MLETPLFREYGEQRMIKGGDVLYALTGRKIFDSNDISIFCLNPGTNYEWTVFFEGAIRQFQRTHRHPSARQCIAYHDHQIFIFPNEE